jgi:nucleoside-diphosphate-sugar epimerase
MTDVVVTGCNGFIGSHLVRTLTEAGHRVIGIGRTPEPSGAGEFVFAELATGIPRRFGDATVIHTAAITRDGFDDTILTTNLLLTSSALMLSDGPFIQVSSSSVYDLRKPSLSARVAEADGAYPWLNSYSESKFRSERLVEDSQKAKAVILRPHGVYGPGDTTLLPRLTRAIRHGALPLPRGGRALHALTSVENLTHAVSLAMSAPIVGTTVFNVTDPDPMTIREAVNAVFGAQAKVASVPLWVARTAARMPKRSGSEPILTPYSVQQLSEDRTYDLSETVATLGYSPELNSINRMMRPASTAAPTDQSR